jgi:hypothetical protein
MTPVTGPGFEFWAAAERGDAAQSRIVSNVTGSLEAIMLSELASIENRLKRMQIL